ncbi:KamA family radical SAM protein [Kitasatospora xanthocidica]|uniref:KamA family radical SAM protein n=1 Tax=Kitasatospora xanthocidica TaxID=83382 RepID=UPI0036F168CF
MDPETRHEIRTVAAVLPFKVNNYVVDELIDWTAAPDDPIYRLTFPDREMLPPAAFAEMSDLLLSDADRATVTAAARRIRLELNPHPSGQLAQNVPVEDGMVVEGLQHKYRETALLFPSQGQTCHAYCGYCFRWAQFVGMPELRLSAELDPSTAYLRRHHEVTDVLFTGGDPMIMSTAVLRRWVAPLLAEGMEHIRTIRFGTKALAYWPHRFTTDADADDLMRLIGEIVDSGRQVAVMLHVSHPRELATDEARTAVRRLLAAGAVLRAQAPIIRHVNDRAETWAEMWTEMVNLGIHPYYAFVERDTGARRYFEVPLATALQIVQDAQRTVSGLARSARGPVMSATPGKIAVDGEATIAGQRVFVLRMLQARDPALVGRSFFAHWSPTASWINHLEPAFAPCFPWEENSGSASGAQPESGHTATGPTEAGQPDTAPTEAGQPDNDLLLTVR